jgi:hypothetical protein
VAWSFLATAVAAVRKNLSGKRGCIARLFAGRAFPLFACVSPVLVAATTDMHGLLSKDTEGRAAALALEHGLPGSCGESGLLAVENIPAGLRGPETARRKDIFFGHKAGSLAKITPAPRHGRPAGGAQIQTQAKRRR